MISLRPSGEAGIEGVDLVFQEHELELVEELELLVEELEVLVEELELLVEELELLVEMTSSILVSSVTTIW